METTAFEKKYPSGQHIEILTGDLTLQQVDAIVNAANSHLIHGGGVAGAIVRRGGDVIQKESDWWVEEHGPVSHVNPAHTGAGNLPCRFVIHAVGPVWGEGEEEIRLRGAIQGSLRVAEELGLSSIAFPAISTGIFGFPLPLAADIFARTIADHFKAYPDSPLALVRIVLANVPASEIFIQAFEKH